MEYLATFYTHYGATRFHRLCQKDVIPARMTPIPSMLSASCGACVRFEADRAPDPAEHDDMERCYTVAPDGVYTPVKG
jgi:hypothetical protein